MKATLLNMHVRDRTRRAATGIGGAANISFTGEVHDDETGLDAYKFRSYNPQLGRWMSPDPSSLRFANLAVPQTFNLYAYVTNDPLKYIDIDGLLEVDNTDVVLAEDGIDTSGGDPMIFAGGDVGGGGGDPTGAASTDGSPAPDPPVDPAPVDPSDPTDPSSTPQVCTTGDCSITIYYGSSPLFGNACSQNHKLDGSVAGTYSVFSCSGNLASCAANAPAFQNACSNQGQVPLVCSTVVTVEFGMMYVCPCCSF